MRWLEVAARRGEPRWSGPAGGVSYSSPQLVTIDGVAQVLLVGAKGAVSVAPADGQPLWQHAWRGFPIVQPAQLEGGDLVIVAKRGERRAPPRAVARPRRVERGRALGLAGAQALLQRLRGPRGAPLRLRRADPRLPRPRGRPARVEGRTLRQRPADSARRPGPAAGTVGGRRAALVEATPDGFEERARFKAIEGKTWNHPALVGDTLLVRNGAEMAAFRLPREGTGEARVVARSE